MLWLLVSACSEPANTTAKPSGDDTGEETLSDSTEGPDSDTTDGAGDSETADGPFDTADEDTSTMNLEDSDIKDSESDKREDTEVPDSATYATDDTEAGDTESEPPPDTEGRDTETSKIDLPEQAAGFLHVEGNKLMDDDGNEARLTGINWFGFETSNQSPHGLWARDYRSMLRQIADLGFNTVRIPWSNAILREDAEAISITFYGKDAYDGADPINADLVDKTPLEILDLIVEAAAEFRLKIVLDNHSREPDGYMEEDFWYTAETSEAQWIEDWVFLAERYAENTTVIALDLNNEPHDGASWGSGDESTDWNTAAQKCGNAIVQVNPNALIIVEGVEERGDDGYWWGGNLTGVRAYPIELDIPEKLVYSAHEYGPEVFQQDWFQTTDFPNNLADIWENYFGFIVKENVGHVFIGEFGIKDPDAYEGRAGVWFETFLEYLKGGYSWTFWCFNPNSGDTEGILEHDWLTPHQWKVDALKPYLAPFIG